jgi:molybdate transport system substrate-binding protein
MRVKTKHPPPGGNSANLLLTGEVELAVQQKPEIMYVKGVEIIGVLPGAFNNITVFAAGLAVDSENAASARALIKMLQSPDTAAVFRTKGLDPS